ncbi:MAG: S41 family peptidase [bacterium]|nr:S41 family peptidase [bacterium]
MIKSRILSRSLKIFGLMVLIVVLSLLFSSGFSKPKSAKQTELYENLKLFSEVLAKVQANYVEEIKPKELVRGAIRGMLRTLDPYSQFMEPEQLKELEIDTKGEFGGLGIRITIRDEWLTVESPMEGTPAFRAGIKSGDKIVEIDGKSTEGITTEEAVKKLRGPKGTQVTLKIAREGQKDLLTFTLTRDIIHLDSVRTKIIVDNIGYIRITEFREKTPDDLEQALVKLEKEGMKAMILDLRYNPGGLLKSAVGVSDLFLPANKVIVSTKGRAAGQDIEYKTTDKKVAFIKYPMAVLINEGSASAAEIVAGAMQDWKRGVIIGPKGKRTFGKGSVQSVMDLSSSCGLRLTTAKYYTPNGKSIHRTTSDPTTGGIVPDIGVEIPAEVELALREKGTLDGAIKLPKTKPDKEKPELEKEMVEDTELVQAINILKASDYFRHLNSGFSEALPSIASDTAKK